MPAFRVFFNGRTLLVDASQTRWFGDKGRLQFLNGNEVVAEFTADSVKGWVKEERILCDDRDKGTE